MAAVGEARPGYELWRPNREKGEAKTTKAIVAFVLIISAALLVIITLGGWERLQSPGIGLLTIAWAGLYVLFAFLVLGWNRGVLPVGAALAMIVIIFAAVATPGWFDRGRDGLSSPLLPEELLGMLTLIVIPVQLLLIIVSLVAFNQEWHVEEERPVDDGHDGYGGDHEEPGYAEEPPPDSEGDYRPGPSAPSTS
jgi:lysylphosphatidylglycerol synthetase-like protein (DUF2156 family)